MEFLSDIAAASWIGFTLLLLVAQVVAREFGHWLGRRRGEAGKTEQEGVGLLVGGMLGVLGFVLALTLSFATTRFSERRAGTLAEANAIGTAWLRAEAVGHPRSVEIARLLQDYTRQRIAYLEAPREPAAVQPITERTNALQTEIWGHLAALVRERQDPATVALMTALNETFDMTTAERFALESRLPAQLIWLLLVMALITMAALGYQLGLRGAGPLRGPSILLIVMWTVIIMTILDLAAPRLGSVRTSTAPLTWTLEGMQARVAIPALPAPR